MTIKGRPFVSAISTPRFGGILLIHSYLCRTGLDLIASEHLGHFHCRKASRSGTQERHGSYRVVRKCVVAEHTQDTFLWRLAGMVEEEEGFLLESRQKKTPYKHIAQYLQKTELACRLHYHQLAYGTKRKRRNTSASSTSSKHEGNNADTSATIQTHFPGKYRQ